MSESFLQDTDPEMVRFGIALMFTERSDEVATEDEIVAVLRDVPDSVILAVKPDDNAMLEVLASLVAYGVFFYRAQAGALAKPFIASATIN